MLRSTEDIKGYVIAATDGDIGHVRDFYFDDRAWMVRYFVVDTGAWLLSREVLISPMAMGQPDWMQHKLPALLTREQVKNSPAIDTARPVSRQHEVEYFTYYGYPDYWDGAGLWGGELYPGMGTPGPGGPGVPSAEQQEARDAYVRAEQAHQREDDPHLRSCKEVVGYHLRATDGAIGHVHSLLLDDQSWAIRYIVVNTSNWWLGHQVLIAPQWITDVSWSDSEVSVNLTRDAVQHAPPYDAAAQLDHEQEVGLYEYYGRPGYWGPQTGPEIKRMGE